MEILYGNQHKINRDLCITIGTMDGVHKGHREILTSMKKHSEKEGLKTALITFKPHPRKVLKNQDVDLITLFDEKIDILQSYGLLDYLIVFEFNKEFASLSPEKFLNLITDIAPVKCITVGYDNHFGKNRSGNYLWLSEYCKEKNIRLTQIKAVNIEKKTISSSAIRELIKSGNLDDAATMLGYRFFITGKVTHGKNVGSKIGFPTANLIFDKDKILPPSGIYSSITCYNGKKYKSALNIGYNPTVSPDDKKLKTEVYLIGYSGNLYGETLRVIILDKIRDEKKYPNIELLKEAIKNDIEKVKTSEELDEVKCFYVYV